MKKILRVTISLVLVAAIILSTGIKVEAAKRAKPKLTKYRKQAERIEEKNHLNVIDTSDLTYKMITHRKGKILVERVIGKVKNNKGDGQVLNNGDNTEYNYICYKNHIDCKKGDIIVTYVLYNPENNIEDDIIARWDYKLKK